MAWKLQILVGLLFLAAVFTVFEFTDLDLRVQDAVYRGDGQWAVNPHDLLGLALFYTGPKVCLIAFSIGCGGLFAFSFFKKSLQPHRRNAALMGISLALVPLGIGTWKSLSNVYCPNQVTRYGGKHLYSKAFERFPADYHPHKRGKGFPCGHSSGGFAMMMLYFVLPGRRARIIGLFGALALGWAMTVYQVLRGEHFLSHGLVTMAVAWIVIVLLARLWPASAWMASPKAAEVATVL